MTLSFSTHWPKRMGGERTFFPEKIWKGISSPPHKKITAYAEVLERYNIDAGEMVFNNSKLHTIRSDSKDRWKAGNKIHPVINNRTPNRFQFAPTMECVSVQKIEIQVGFAKSHREVWIDNNKLSKDEIEELALNDGFVSVEHFFQWFNKDFTGKIIHWTDLKY